MTVRPFFRRSVAVFVLINGFVMGAAGEQGLALVSAINDHFFVFKKNYSEVIRWPVPNLGLISAQDSSDQENLEKCRQNIAKVICSVDAEYRGKDFLSRQCLPGGQSYVHFFEGHFDRSPPQVQRMYCHLERIFIEHQFYATAYASVVLDQTNEIRAGVIGVRKSVLESERKLGEWASWKEETSFGGSTTSTQAPLGLIHYSVEGDSKAALLDYILNHEFAHIFDLANDIIRVDDCEWEQKEEGKWEVKGTCHPAAGSFGEISWQSMWKAKPENRFLNDENLCYYTCAGKFLDPLQAIEIFDQFFKTNFVTPYASVNPNEDWAETFANMLLGRDINLTIRTPQGQRRTWSVKEHLLSARLKEKANYVRNFLKSSVKYPGQ